MIYTGSILFSWQHTSKDIILATKNYLSIILAKQQTIMRNMWRMNLSIIYLLFCGVKHCLCLMHVSPYGNFHLPWLVRCLITTHGCVLDSSFGQPITSYSGKEVTHDIYEFERTKKRIVSSERKVCRDHYWLKRRGWLNEGNVLFTAIYIQANMYNIILLSSSVRLRLGQFPRWAGRRHNRK